MKIICTKEEKEGLVVAIMTSYPCMINPSGCDMEKDVDECWKCIDAKIEWEITDDERA